MQQIPLRVLIVGSIAMKILLHHFLLSVCAVWFLSLDTSPILSAGEPVGVLVGFAKQRSWSDSTGSHRIDASLKTATADEVQLEQSNGKVFKIPFAKLSATDQAFIESFLLAEAQQKKMGKSAESENPFKVAEDQPPPSSTSSPSGIPIRPATLKGAKQISAKLDKPFWNASPPIGFPDVNFEEQAVATELEKPFFAAMRVLSAGKSGICVMNAYQQGRSKEENYSRFVVVRASNGEASEVREFPDPWKLMGISPDGQRVAAVRVEGFDKGNDVAILKVTPQGISPEFQFKAGGGSWDELHFVGFAGGNRLVTISQKHTLVVWDLDGEPGPKAIFQGNSGGSLHATMSPAGDMMILPAGKSIVAVDMSTAKTSGLILRETQATQLSISTDGTQIATFEPFQVSIYSTKDGRSLKDFAVTEHNPAAIFRWVGKYLLVGSVVYDVEKGIPLWTYEGEPSSQSVVGSYLVCAFGGDKSSSVTIDRVPSNRAMEEASTVDPETIYAIRPRDIVSVQYRLGTASQDLQAAIRKSVEAKIEKLGWRLNDDSTNQILIELEQGKQESADYYTRNGFGPVFFPPPGFGPPPSGPKEVVTFTPWTHKITITSKDAKVYFASMVRSSPDNLETRDDESTQSAVSRICQPVPTYFESLPIPPHLLKVQYQGGFGKSKLQASGFQP